MREERRGWRADVLVTAAAEQDYAESLSWYGQRSKSAALEFEAEFERAIRLICESTRRFPQCDGLHRFYLMRPDPFQVIYRETSHGLLIVAVAHAKRHPGYWRDR